MADDSDIDSWYLKQDHFRRTGSSTLSSSISKFDNSPHTYNQSIPKSSRSGTEVRFINPAIYAESTTDRDEPNLIVEVRCGDSNDNDIENGLSALSVNDQESSRSHGDQSDLNAASDTYRCQSETSRTSTLTLTNNSKSITRLIRRCAITGSSKVYENDQADDDEVRRFTLNGRRVVQFSSTSLSCGSSCSDSRTSGLTLARKIAHEEWVQKKDRAARQKEEAERRAEARRKAEEDREERERLERDRKERENFLRWQERKKIDEANRKSAVERELDLQRRFKAVEDQVAVAKIVHLKQWARRKEEAQKGFVSYYSFPHRFRNDNKLTRYDGKFPDAVCVAQQKEEELKRKAIAEERKKRLEQSSEAFEKWREISKGRPRPATQGLLR